ncbi:hypothetical protein [Cytobacillus firmus]
MNYANRMGDSANRKWDPAKRPMKLAKRNGILQIGREKLQIEEGSCK